jgi:hypothetical protein
MQLIKWGQYDEKKKYLFFWSLWTKGDNSVFFLKEMTCICLSYLFYQLDNYIIYKCKKYTREIILNINNIYTTTFSLNQFLKKLYCVWGIQVSVRTDLSLFGGGRYIKNPLPPIIQQKSTFCFNQSNVYHMETWIR